MGLKVRVSKRLYFFTEQKLLNEGLNIDIKLLNIIRGGTSYEDAYLFDLFCTLHELNFYFIEDNSLFFSQGIIT